MFNIAGHNSMIVLHLSDHVLPLKTTPLLRQPHSLNSLLRSAQLHSDTLISRQLPRHPNSLLHYHFFPPVSTIILHKYLESCYSPHLSIVLPITLFTGFYCRSYCLLNMFRASLCPSSVPHIKEDTRSKSHHIIGTITLLADQC